jgi:hypothetical protein
MWSGVTKSGSPTPREIASGKVSAMEKYLRIPLGLSEATTGLTSFAASNILMHLFDLFVKNYINNIKKLIQPYFVANPALHSKAGSVIIIRN